MHVMVTAPGRRTHQAESVECGWLPFLDAFEPCAWRRIWRFGGCLRRSGGCGSPSDAALPGVCGNGSAPALRIRCPINDGFSSHSADWQHSNQGP
jgi:hypothetical protein